MADTNSTATPVTTAAAENMPMADVTATTPKEEDLTGDGGVIKRILKEGSGWETPKDGAEVKVHYVGTLLDGSKFDSSRDRSEPFEFKLGAHQVIKGWEEAVQTMKKGELAHFKLTAPYAYGAAGSPPKIPPNATLQFEIELLSWCADTDLSKAKDGSVLKRTLKEGDGWERPKRETAVTLHVQARLGSETGALVQDTRAAGQPLRAVIGAGELPHGLEKTVKSMKKGERAAAVVAPPHAPPHSETVYYDVELLDMQKEKEPWEMSNEDKLAQAAARREHGNALFKAGDVRRAAKRYKSALACLTSDHAFSDAQKQQARAAQLPCHLNVAACAIKQRQWKAAADSAKKALDIDAHNVKALFRHAQALVELGELAAAARDISAALGAQPADAELLALQKRVRAIQAQQDQRDKAVFAKMFAAH